MTGAAPVNVIAVTSGKGGVGKTNVAVNLAVSLAESGQEVLLFDADLGLANVDIALGLKPEYDIQHVIKGERTLDEILIDGPSGIRVIPASSGVARMAALSPTEQAGLVRAFSELAVPVDTLIVDTGAGIDNTVLTFTAACQELIVVICDEPTSLTDGYALVKVLNQHCNVKRFQILANMVDNDLQGRQLFEKLCSVTDRFLDVHLGYLGAIPRDDYLRRAIRSQQAVVTAYPRSDSAQALRAMSDRVKALPTSRSAGGLGFFVERLIEYRSGSV
ncbi:MinD/ParA family protein [Congregibacter sp.]|uniref:MinD/ParA family protein n=1 Tax=Congregibacter sp. TaxID=2744308 RepID=UPI00385E5BCD